MIIRIFRRVQKITEVYQDLKETKVLLDLQEKKARKKARGGASKSLLIFEQSELLQSTNFLKLSLPIIFS